MRILSVYILLCFSILISPAGVNGKDKNRIVPGGESTEQYFPLLQGKTIAVVANQTAILGNHHLVDSLKRSGIKIKCVFAPEHGFRGEAGNGDKIKDGIDTKTGIPIISLYGKHLKPTAKDLAGVKVVVFDIQDVGVRFFTYISTLQYVMEACAELKIKLIVLDRPNPNGYYVDGPVLKKEFSSFIGMQSVPIVYGMTIGEYAMMLNGEKWLSNKKQCDLKVVSLINYDHNTRSVIRIPPSPNLPDMDAIYLYPSFCLFEGARVSLGRGTTAPFRLIGFPEYKNKGAERDTSFTPKNIKGVATNPPYADTLCYGLSFIGKGYDVRTKGEVNLDVLIHMYNRYPEKDKFFTPFFNKLAGTDELQKQIRAGKSAEEIKKSWQKDLDAFKLIRKKYLLYPDFK
jgi:uncharacterized protein YbbC (DUF1343 family)